MSIFLDDEDIDRLTGIKKGRNGFSKNKLQCEFLRKSGIAFVENARGAPVVTRAVLEGKKEQIKKEWEPRAVHA